MKKEYWTGMIYMRYCAFIFTFIILLSVCTQRSDHEGVLIREASGIARIGETLYIVGDDADGHFFTIDLEGQKGPIIIIDPMKVRQMPMPHAELARDLEAIDDLADGRLAILSEQLRSLIARKNLNTPYYSVIAEYDKTLTEFGHRGLEGLAAKPLGGGGSRLAVLWEGGYPIFRDVPGQFHEMLGSTALKPVVVVHDIENGNVARDVLNPLYYFLLNVPEPEGKEPLAQRFRATDLVWHRPEEGDEEIIVLMASENAPPHGSSAPREYKLKWLQRFNLQGEPMGMPLDMMEVTQRIFSRINEEVVRGHNPQVARHLQNIVSLLKQGDWENVNWEGLDWFEEGESLITIYDKKPIDPPCALVIQIPQEWK